MNKLKISLISLATAAVFFLSGITAAAADFEKIETQFNSTAAYLQSCPTPTVGAIGGEWLIIGLARAGKLSGSMADDYCKNVEAYVKSKNSDTLHRTKATENARVILALTSIGKNPENVAGFNLLMPLADYNYVCKQGLNGPVWTLIALDSVQYDIPDNKAAKVLTTRDKLIDYILSSQSPNGGWDYSGEGADSDMTAMAIQALAPYKNRLAVKPAIDKALEAMSKLQRSNGSFATYGDDTAESNAQAITAFCSLGIDCETDARFIKNNKSAIDALMNFSIDRGFSHVSGDELNQMSTEQGFYALTAYKRLVDKQTFIYDMCDLLTKFDVNLDGNVNINDVTLIQKSIANLTVLTLRQNKTADCNGDGEINIKDVTYLQKHIAGYEGY